MDEKRYPAIGVMIGGVYTDFPREVINGVARQAEEENASVFFFLRIHTAPFFKRTLGAVSNNAYDYQFNTIHDYCKIGGMDGIIINYGTIGFHMNRDNAAEFIRQYNDVPIILVTEKVELPNCYSIICNNRQGMFDVVEHLITEHGCRRILFMRGPRRNTDAIERLQGYMDAMLKHGLTVEPGMIGQGDFTEFVDYEVERLLDAYPDADAIAFSNDTMAVAGYRVCRSRGISIGDEMKITGYDSSESAEKMDPPLTSVFQDAGGMGKRALHEMMDLLHGKIPTEARYPVSLVERESCGCTPKAEDEATDPVDYAAEVEHLRQEAIRREKEFSAYQDKSWVLPMMARDLNDCMEDETEFCGVVMEKLRQMNARAAHLFLLDQPLAYDGVSEWECPDNLYLASSYSRGKIKSYPIYDRPRVTRDNGIAQLTEDGERHEFMVFLLFSNERQYGLLVCDVPTQELPLFYVMSLQIGLSLRYFELSQIEVLRRRQLAQDMEAMRQRNRELDMISGYDQLTGLLNLRGLTEQVKRLCIDGEPHSAYVIYCDMDHLKEINDTWGHPEGNFAIKASAGILRSNIRETDLLARVGGDEFIAVITSDAASFPTEFLTRLRSTCGAYNEKSDKPYMVELSAGVQGITLRSYADFEAAIADADRQLYEAKKQRRRTVRKLPL